MKKYFRRTDQSVLISADVNSPLIQVVYGTEGSIGVENTQESSENLTDGTIPIEEQKAKFSKLIDDLLNSGYIETKEQDKFPKSIDVDDYYDEPIIEISIKELETSENVEHFSLAAWDDAGASEPPEKMLEYLIENKEKYQYIEHFTFGNMDFQVCEISWIHQCSYGDFFKAFPNIKSFSAQGSVGLELGKMDLPNLEILEIMGSGLTKKTLNDISKSSLPKIKKLNIFVGDDDYGCDVTALDIKEFLANTNFTNLINLGICNIDANSFSETLKAIIESKYAKLIKVLDISKSVALDDDAEYLLENIDKLSNIKYIDLTHNFFTSAILEKLKDCPIEINVDENEEPDFYEGELCSGPMYSE